METAQLTTSLLIVTSLHAAAEPLICPDGTRQQSSGDRSSAGLFMEWCGRADGTPHGPYRSFSGRVRSTVGEFVDGKQDGTWLSWGPDGQHPFEEQHFRLGLHHGPWLV